MDLCNERAWSESAWPYPNPRNTWPAVRISLNRGRRFTAGQRISSMQDFPHFYAVTATGFTHGDVALTADKLSSLLSASPSQFGGPGDVWSPETLLVGAIGDCLVLTFRAVAYASKLPWTALRCDVTGTLDRVDHITRFTSFDVHAHLDIPDGTDPAAARRVLEKAERTCLISNSLKAPIHLVPDVTVAANQSELVAV